MTAGRADVMILLQFESVYDGTAFRTLGPEAFWHVVSFLLIAELGFAENSHDEFRWWFREGGKATLGS